MKSTNNPHITITPNQNNTSHDINNNNGNENENNNNNNENENENKNNTNKSNDEIDELIDTKVYTLDTRQLILSEQSMNDIINNKQKYLTNRKSSNSRDLIESTTDNDKHFDILSLLFLLSINGKPDDDGKPDK